MQAIIEQLTAHLVSLAILRSDNLTVLVPDATVKYLMMLKKSWDYPYDGSGNAWAEFQAQWLLYNGVYAGELERALDALDASYNPISNYDMVEQGADGERKAKNTTTVTPHGKITQTTEVTGTMETATSMYQSGVDSTGDGVLTDKQVAINTPTNRKNTTETTYAAGTDSTTETTSDNDKSASAGSHTLTGLDRGSEHVLTRSGNIGVTTSQQMIESELELRRQEYIKDYVNRFIGYHCTLVEGVSTW